MAITDRQCDVTYCQNVAMQKESYGCNRSYSLASTKNINRLLKNQTSGSSGVPWKNQTSSSWRLLTALNDNDNDDSDNDVNDNDNDTT